jgi:hypothetical protein
MTLGPIFKLGTAPSKANVFAEAHMRQWIIASGADTFTYPGFRDTPADCELFAVDEFVLRSEYSAASRQFTIRS